MGAMQDAITALEEYLALLDRQAARIEAMRTRAREVLTTLRTIGDDVPEIDSGPLTPTVPEFPRGGAVRRTPQSDEVKAQLLWERGVPVKEISERTGIGESMVYYLAKARGWAARSKRSKGA